jgi:hypothetical protein
MKVSIASSLLQNSSASSRACRSLSTGTANAMGVELSVTAREIADALIARKAPQATRKQAIDLRAVILVALRKRNGATVVDEGGARAGD